MVVLDDDAFATLLRRAMVLMTRVDGHVDEDEVVRIQWIMKRRFGRDLDAQTVRSRVHEQISTGVRLHDLLAEHAATLGEQQKSEVLKVAFAVASADGAIVDEEDVLLIRIAKSLSIGPAEYRTILRHAMVAREFL